MIYFLITSGILALLIRSLIKLYIDKDITKFKNDLEKEAHRDSKKFDELHNKRIIIIDNTYKKLVKVEDALIAMVSPYEQISNYPTKEELPKHREIKFNIFEYAIIDFMSYIKSNRLYFNTEIVNILENIREYCMVNGVHFMFRDSHGDLTITFDQREKLLEKIQKDIPELKIKLEKLFKKIIGE